MFTSKRNDVEPMAALLSLDTTYKTYLWKVCVEARESTESNSTWKAEMPSSKHELRVCVYFFFFIYLFFCLFEMSRIERRCEERPPIECV